MASLLSKSLPPDWSGGETVFWYHGSGSHNHPATDWLELLWSYLRKNFATAEELRRFEGLPLIPLDMSEFPVSLVRLRLPSKIVVRSLHDDSVHETLAQTLKELGVVIIQYCPDFLSLHPAVINTCIHPPSSHGVLKALVACSSTIPTGIHSVTDEGKRSLRNFVSKVSSLEPQAKQLLCSLPLFETLSRSFVSKTEGLCAAPEGSFPVASRKDLIDVTHDDSKRLAHLLDIRILSPIDFLLEIVFPDVKGGHYCNEEIDRLMAFVMERYQVFTSADARIEEAMKSLPFVSTNSGKARAMDLFDPRKDVLKAILAEKDVFPVGAQYTNPAVLVVLEKLGMKSENEINAQDLYQSAKMISVMSNISAAKQKSETMMSYLHSNPMKLQGTIFGEALALLLKDIPWISAIRQKPHGFPKTLHLWAETREAHFFKPMEVTTADKINLIGTVKPIVRVDSSSQLAKCFGWDKMPIALDVVEHLKTVISHYTQDEKPYYIAIVKDIYSFLSHAVDPDPIKEALQGIENSNWIWNGDGFSSPDLILAERPSIDLTPYICSLPSEVLQFSSFFSTFGMREHCDDLFLLQVLHIIKRKYESGCSHPTSDVKKDLQLSVDILNEVKPNVGERLCSELQEKILIPTHVEGDSYVKLAPVAECMYCEHEWLERGNHDEDMDFLYVHPNIPNSTAELLQVRPLPNRMLEPDEMQIGDEFGQEEKLTRRLNRLLEEYTDGFAEPKELIENADDAGATEVKFLYDERTNEDAMTCLIDEGMDRLAAVGTPFGQKEKLTNRLQRLLTAYPCEKEILKELLQNADDAEATEICFIKDPRQHPDEHVFKDSWKPLQGPALCVYNNKPFTKADIKGIQNLGEGIKGDDPNKTGQYGVGFNAVYHLTDVPSFASSGEEIGDVLCVFDPLCKYVPGANPREPGRMFIETTRLRGIFPDVFSCYNEDHFPLRNSTMFRFPLRTQEMARDSEISKSAVTLEALEKMMEALKSELFEVLLFVNNVKKITLCDIDENGQVVNSYFAEAEISKEDSAERQKFASYVKQTGKSGKENDDVLAIDAQVKKCSYVLNLKDSTGKAERWLIVQQIGFENKVEKSIVDAYRRHDLGMLPRGGVACLLENTSRVEVLLERKKKVYCFLPLPVETDLPVHINGHFALDHEARRSLWRDETSGFKSDWNNALMSDVIPSCYLTLLDKVRVFYQLPVTQSSEELTLNSRRDAVKKNIDDYEKLFPYVVSGNTYWTNLVTSVYHEMDRKRLRLLPVLRDYTSEGSTPNCQLTWLPPTGDGKDKAFFNNLGENDCFRSNQQRRFDKKEKKRRIKEKASFEKILLQTGFNLVAFSLSVCKAIRQSGVQSCHVSPSAVMEFYKSYSGESPLCRIRTISVGVRDTPFKNVQIVATVLKYCKDSEQFLEHLPGLPLLVTQDNHLRAFNASDPKFLSRHQRILPHCKEMFVHDYIRTHIFGDSKSREASVFKYFDVKSFAASLHRTLPRQYLNSGGYVEWYPKQNAEPNSDWVYSMWNFLYEETEKERKANEEKFMKNLSTNQPTRLSEEENTRIVKSVLEPLNNWSILPCTETIRLPKSREGNASGMETKHFLVPLMLAESVLDFTSHDTTSRLLVEALRMLSLPQLNNVVLSSTGTSIYTSSNSWRLARRLVASINSPRTLLTSLNQKMTTNPHSLHGKLRTRECLTILEYFSNSVEQLQERDKNTLRRLPFYQATHGGLVSLNSKSVCVVPIEMPRKELEVLELQGDVVFLSSRLSLSPLFKFLAFESVSSVDVYCNFILKNFSLFSNETRSAHLVYIRDWILSRISTAPESDKRRLLNCLTNTGIVPSSDDTLVKVSCYYDPEHVVFKTMLSEDMFPPKPFNTKEWLPFLKTIGLIHEVSRDLFMKFSMDVAREGATQRTEKTDKKSKVLVAHLFSRKDVVEEGLLEAICDIRFVATDPVKPELCAMHPPYGQSDYGQTPYIPFKGSVLAKHAEIVWTTASLLPKWANPKKYHFQMNASVWRSENDYCNAIVSHLRTLAEPTVDLVTFHCQNVSFELEKDNESDLS